MTATPEHDKIDELRRANPLATNLLHLLLSVPGWVIVNDLVEPPVQVPVSRIAAALLGVDAVAYRSETEARFGLDDVPAGIAETVISWSEEDAVIDELRELAELASQRAGIAFDAAVAESPIAAAAGADAGLVSETTVFADPDPEIPVHLRGTLAGAAVGAGLLDAEAAAAHPAAAFPVDTTEWPLPPNTDQIISQVRPIPTPFTVPLPQAPTDAFPTGLFAPGSAPLVPDAPVNLFAPPAPPVIDGVPTSSPFDSIQAPLLASGVPAPTFEWPQAVTDEPLYPIAISSDPVVAYEPADQPEIVDPFAIIGGQVTTTLADEVWYDEADDGTASRFDIPYSGRGNIVEGSGDLADANDDDDEQLIYPGYDPKNAPLA